MYTFSTDHLITLAMDPTQDIDVIIMADETFTPGTTTTTMPPASKRGRRRIDDATKIKDLHNKVKTLNRKICTLQSKLSAMDHDSSNVAVDDDEGDDGAEEQVDLNPVDEESDDEDSTAEVESETQRICKENSNDLLNLLRKLPFTT